MSFDILTLLCFLCFTVFSLLSPFLFSGTSRKLVESPMLASVDTTIADACQALVSNNKLKTFQLSYFYSFVFIHHIKARLYSTFQHSISVVQFGELYKRIADDTEAIQLVEHQSPLLK